MKAITFRRLEAASFTHSAIYVSLLICAFVLGSPQPVTFILGMAHGVMWIGMSLVCLAAARARIIPLWLAVNVVILGGLGPFDRGRIIVYGNLPVSGRVPQARCAPSSQAS